MAKFFLWVLLGVVVGIVGGSATAYLAPPMDYVKERFLIDHYHRVIGASVGGVVAVILCCTRAILDAIKHGKGPS
jgi:hypothetical protein